MDRHGVEIVKHGKQKYYSPDFKINAIDRVLLNHEPSIQVSLDLGLPNVGMLSLWIQSFKETCYTIVEKQRGRKSYDQKESKDDTGTIREGKRTTSSTEPETYHRERILKKLNALVQQRETRVKKK